MIQFCWQCPEHHSQVPAKNTPSLLVQALSGYLALVTSMSWSFFTACLIRCLLALTPTASTSVLLSSIFMADSMVGEIWWWHSGKLVLLGALFGRYMGCLQGHRVLGTGRWVARGSSACGYGLLLALSSWFSRHSLGLGPWEGRDLPSLLSTPSLITIILTIKTWSSYKQKSVVLISNLHLDVFILKTAFLKIPSPVSNSTFFCIT